MELITNNPYRIAGILSNASERELQKQKTKIKAYAKVGKEIGSDYDFQVLDEITRTEDSIDKAFATIEQNQDKVNYALFWFLNANPFDNTAIDYLKKGDAEKAIEIWEKVTQNKDVNSKNFSAFNNLGTYKLLSQNQQEIKEGIKAKIKLIESEYFENFIHSVADKTFTIDNQKQIEKMVDELLTQFKNQYSSSEILQLFSGCNETTQQYLSKKFTEEPLHRIESRIESCKKKRKAEKSNAYEFGLKLVTDSEEDYRLLNSILGSNDLKFKTIADQLASEIMQCGIDYFLDSSSKCNSFSC
jgi:tetratricopeptide (TPR) repeat protein